MSTRARRIVGWTVGVLAAVVVIATLTPQSAGPGHLIALHRFLSSLNVPVSDAAAPPSGGVYLLPADRRTDAQIAPLLAWTQGGGRLIVTDPSSAIFDRFGVRSSRAAIMPHPMSTPTADGITAPSVGITEPTVAPMPTCASGMSAT